MDLSRRGSTEDLDEIEAALTEFFDAFRRSRARLQRARALRSLSLSEFAVLRAAAIHGSEGISRIAAAADMTQPPATRALERLEKKELVRRTSHPNDARVTAVEVTAAGRRLLAHHRSRVRDAAALVAERAGPMERGQVASLLRALAAAFEEASI